MKNFIISLLFALTIVSGPATSLKAQTLLRATSLFPQALRPILSTFST